jgi:ectoine hydroxylase-related dioxygenase (phytanoyl-CoA dioxygenase family)
MKEVVMSVSNYRLSEEQKGFYQNNGYLTGLPPIYTSEEMRQINAELPGLLALLRPDETAKDIREWHETSTYLYDLCMNPKVLDLVEGILGPNFYLWASSFFIKEPFSKSTVGWHQDAYYWPMKPHNSVTVWLAYDDVNEENGGMKIIPGSHLAGLLQHKRQDQTDSIITLELETGTFREAEAVQFKLQAGEVSLHDDRAVHGSPANPSSRRRAGLTMRYSGTNVWNDLAVNPNFKTYLCRGVDEYRLNPIGTRPTQRYGRPSFSAVSIEEAGPGAETVHTKA